MLRFIGLRFIGAIGVAFALSAGPAAMASEAGVTADQIKIGVQLPLTGPASFVGQGAKVGIDAALAEINDHGGVNGRTVAVVYADDRGTPDGGVAAVRRLVDEEQVLAVFNTATSTATVSALPFFQQNGVPYLVSFASDPRVLEKFYPNIYAGATVSQIDGVASYVKYLTENVGAKSVGMLVCDQAHCTSGAPLLKKGLEDAGVAVTMASFNSGDTDFTGQIRQIRSANPDAVFVYGLAADGGRIFPQIRRAGIEAPLVSDTSLADLAVVKLAGSSADGYVTFWLGGKQFLNDKTGAMGQFFESLDKYGIEQPSNTPNLYTLMAYSDFYVLAEGLRGAGDEPTRAGLIESFDTNIRDFVAGSGPWDYAASFGMPRTFTPTDHKGNRVVQPVVYQDGTFKPVGP